MKACVLGSALLRIVGAVLLASCGSDGEGGNHSEDRFVQALGDHGFDVQQGKFGYVDTSAECCSANPTMPSCYGASANAPYLAVSLPPAPDQDPSTITPVTVDQSTGLLKAYKLRADEAIVLVGKTPPPMKYFSYVFYLYLRYSEQAGTRVQLWDSLDDTFNNQRIHTEGTPDGSTGNPFEQRMMLIYTADRTTDSGVRQAAAEAGYPTSMLNTGPISTELAHMGLTATADDFQVLNRLALPTSENAMNAYLADPNIHVYRITPRAAGNPDLLPVPTLIPKGTGVTEAASVPGIDLPGAVEELRAAILANQPGMQATELTTGLAIYDSGAECIEHETNCLADSRDSTYLRSLAATGTDITSGPPYFTLGTGEYLIVYGANHAATGKTTYSSFTLYWMGKFLGVGGVTSDTYTGSGADYIADTAKAPYLYAWKISRDCGQDPHCLPVATSDCSTGVVGAPLDGTFYLFYRNYLETATGVGPEFNDLILDRAILFSPQAPLRSG